VLTATTQGCPSQCAGKPYSGAVYSSVQSFNSGTFEYTMKTSNVSGSAVIFWITGYDNADGWNAYQFLIVGNSPTQVSLLSLSPSLAFLLSSSPLFLFNFILIN